MIVTTWRAAEESLVAAAAVDLASGRLPVPTLLTFEGEQETVAARPGGDGGADPLDGVCELLHLARACRVSRLALGMPLPLTADERELSIAAVTAPQVLVIVRAWRAGTRVSVRVRTRCYGRGDDGQVVWAVAKRQRRAGTLGSAARWALTPAGPRHPAALVCLDLLRRGHVVTVTPGWADRYGLSPSDPGA